MNISFVKLNITEEKPIIIDNNIRNKRRLFYFFFKQGMCVNFYKIIITRMNKNDGMLLKMSTLLT